MPGRLLGTGAPIMTRVGNRTERLRQRAWRMRPYRSDERHIIVGGAPRSGTTLLRRIFERHPGLCSGPETKLFVPAGFNLAWLASAYAIDLDVIARMRRESPSQAAFIDAFAAHARAVAGKGRWVEKTPMNIRHLGWIAGHFPRVAIVHLVRDGRDVVCSMREHPDWRWVDGGWQKVLVPRPTEWYARRWVEDTAAGMAWRSDPRYVEVRYEDLVTDPEQQLRRLCEAIGEPVDAGWLAEVVGDGTATAEAVADVVEDAVVGASSGASAGRPDDKGAISRASLGRWRTDLRPADLEVVTRVSGRRLAELGYPET